MVIEPDGEGSNGGSCPREIPAVVSDGAVERNQGGAQVEGDAHARLSTGRHYFDGPSSHDTHSIAAGFIKSNGMSLC